MEAMSKLRSAPEVAQSLIKLVSINSKLMLSETPSKYRLLLMLYVISIAPTWLILLVKIALLIIMFVQLNSSDNSNFLVATKSLST